MRVSPLCATRANVAIVPDPLLRLIGSTKTRTQNLIRSMRVRCLAAGIVAV